MALNGYLWLRICKDNVKNVQGWIKVHNQYNNEMVQRLESYTVTNPKGAFMSSNHITSSIIGRLACGSKFFVHYRIANKLFTVHPINGGGWIDAKDCNSPPIWSNESFRQMIRIMLPTPNYTPKSWHTLAQSHSRYQLVGSILKLLLMKYKMKLKSTPNAVLPKYISRVSEIEYVLYNMASSFKKYNDPKTLVARINSIIEKKMKIFYYTY